MKRNRIPRRARKTPDVDLACQLAISLSQSSSQIEDSFWNVRLAQLVNRLLSDQDEEAIIGALDHLYNIPGSTAYDALASMVETCAESRQSEAAGGAESLMFIVPILAWSRFPIPAGTIQAHALAALRVQLSAHVLAADVKLSLVDALLSPDQLPQNYSETAQLLDRLAKAAVHDRNLKVDPEQMGETIEFLSDARYLVGVVSATKGAPLFRWQETDGSQTEAFRQWAMQGGDVLRPLLPNCALEFLPVRAFHAAIRDADRASRPWSLRATVTFLQTVLNVAANQLRAVVAPFHDRQLEEFRIGFTRRGDSAVLHGVVWPILDPEDETNDTPAQIEAILQEAGVSSVLILEQRFPLEFCDDCGAPLYPNPEGEPTHAELPEDQVESTPRHLH